MTQEEIIRMAREAGCDNYGDCYEFIPETLERFAALVTAHEREKLMNVAIFSKWYQELDAAVLAERESCAKVCEEIDVAAFGGERPAPNDCAAAIRARG